MPDSRRNPFEGVTDFVSELGRMRTLGIHGPAYGDAGVDAPERTHASAWVPVIDILARGDDLLIRVELPGARPDDVDLHLHHGVLTVSGSRSSEGEAPADFFVRERHRGAFRRALTLPEGTEADHLEASFDHGLLEVVVRGAARPETGSRIAMTDRSTPPTTLDVTGG